MSDDRERKHPGITAAERQEAVQRLREAAEKRRVARKQMTPDAAADDTTEGEGSPGLNIGGGGGSSASVLSLRDAVIAHAMTAFQGEGSPHTGRSPFTVTRVPERVCGQ